MGFIEPDRPSFKFLMKVGQKTDFHAVKETACRFWKLVEEHYKLCLVNSESDMAGVKVNV